MGASIYVTNPNRYLLQQMGLANPLLVAWELVPFSFVVDWVADVGTSLGGITDLLGCTVIGPYTTYYAKGKVRSSWYWQLANARTTLSGHVVVIKRKKGFDYPLPNLSFRANIGSSLNRAANAVSLLGQILTK